MKPDLNKGQLIKWNDDRGFGFIKPSEGGREVFLHITSVKTTGRRPQIGDIIFYQLITEADGKIRASNALIQGAVSQTSIAQKIPSVSAKTKKKKKGNLFLTAVAIGGVSAFILLVMQFLPKPSLNSITSIQNPHCLIKGNISINTRKRLYHTPGMEDYASTVISPEDGERWFCTETEAIQAGWIRAPR